MTDCSRQAISGSCLGRTCMKWAADGELTAVDLHLVLKRLALVDRHGATLVRDQPES
jgi:hypothetical protein